MYLNMGRLTESQAREVASWEYDEEYAIYNLPPWEVMVRREYSLCDDIKRERYISFVNERMDLVGIVNLLDEGESVFFGIGINPDFCGRGIGKLITGMALIECGKRFPGKPVVLDVRTWNKRAVNCYISQGFKITETRIQETNLGYGKFYIMKYDTSK